MKNTEFATRVIGQLSLHLANSQEMADKIFYGVPVTTTRTLDDCMQRADYIKRLTVNLGIAEEVYEAAYQIYDFRNSGKDGYTLKDGKIVIDPEILARENEELIKKVAELEYLLNQTTLRFNPPRCGCQHL